MSRRPVIVDNPRRGGLWWRGPVVLLAWLTVGAPVVGVLAVVATLRGYVEDLPQLPNLGTWTERLPRTSYILAADGSVLAELPFHVGKEVGHRRPVTIDKVPRQLLHAFLAAEDLRFFHHRGVDVRSVLRAAWANHRAGRIVEGASTITQQVARNLLPEEIGFERSLRRKVREAILAQRIEKQSSKHEILEVYLNHLFLGANSYGVVAAARSYFDKTLEELTLAESATIAGLAQAPGRADPFRDRAAAGQRRDQVLDRMLGAGLIGAQEHRDAIASALDLSPPRRPFGERLPWYTEAVRRELQASYPERYSRGGLVVVTAGEIALGSKGQELADAWSAKLASTSEHGAPQIGAVVIDQRTGYVDTIIGGRTSAGDDFNRAVQACRQPGSAFKPILYAAALEDNSITPGTALRDAPIAEYDDQRNVHWKPTNSGRTFRGVALAQDALALSLNAPAVDVLDRVGSARVLETAKRLGISTKIADVRPLALGSSCLYPMELATAIATLAADGNRVVPRYIKTIRRDDIVVEGGESPYDPYLRPAEVFDRLAWTVSDHGRPERVFDSSSAFLLKTMMHDVTRRGTATDARALGRPAGGKTGTTNGNTDAWFVGFTARMTAVVWVGHDDPAKTLGPHNDGSHAALPLWMGLVKESEGARPAQALWTHIPDDVVQARVDRETGFLAAPGAGGALDLYFKRGTEPNQRSDDVRNVPRSMGRIGREF